MSDSEEEKKKAEKAKKIKDLIREAQSLSLEDKNLLAAALGDVKPTLGGVKPKVKGAGIDGQEPSGQSTFKQQLVHTPRISTFSGDDAKGEISYDQWRQEVLALEREGLPEATIHQCLRRSIRGTAADVVHNLGEEVSISEIVDKLDQMYGNVLPSENILEKFYSSRQEGQECVAAWACRLESIMAQIRKKEKLSKPEEESRLRSKFFSGLLKGNVKTAVRHRYDEGESYKELLVAARVAELEDKDSEKEKSVKSHSMMAEEKKKFDDLMSAMEKLTKRLDKLEQQNKKEGKEGHRHVRPQQQQQQQFPEQHTPAWAAQYPEQQTQTWGAQATGTTFNGTCYSCGEFGHRKYECPLNSYQPASGTRGWAGKRQ